MGTNYYFKENVCPHCHRSERERHIGKSSAGWCFSLHIYPQDGIKTLEDWKPRFVIPDAVIRDEYGRVVTPQDMADIISNRGSDETKWEKTPMSYTSWAEFHRQNYSERGPKGLLRHVVGQFCSGHGEGTWDYIEGEFS